MIRLFASVTLSLPLFLLVIGPTVTEAQLEGRPCVANQTMGVYKPLKQCPLLYKKWLQTSSAANVPEDSIWCCPNEASNNRKRSIREAPTADSYAIAKAKCKIYKETSSTIPILVPPIIGGVEANVPLYNVAIYSNNSTAFENFVCGGTLISERYVLTAAHCTYSINSGSANWIRAGVVNINATGGQSIKIIQRKKHPCYKGRYNLQHDIALLELEKNVTFDEHVQPACLPYSSLNFTKAKATGWGYNEFAGDILPVLHEVTVPIQKCESQAKWKFCADESGKGTCQGDSGGALAILNQEYKNMYTLVGVTSGGLDCAVVPGTYMNVSYYVPWIQRIVWPTGDYNQTEICSDP